jgi:hypothetical protein
LEKLQKSLVNTAERQTPHDVAIPNLTQKSSFLLCSQAQSNSLINHFPLQLIGGVFEMNALP